MKLKAIPLLLIGSIFLQMTIAAQPGCPLERYQLLLWQADSLFFKERAYSQAIRKYTAAKDCQPKYSAEIDQRIASVFELVNRQRIEADSIRKEIQRQQKITQQSLEKANRLVSYFNFGKEKAAWAYDAQSGRFAVLDKGGNQLTDFLYESPESFNGGMAIAKVNNQFVILDDKGKERSERYDFLMQAIGGYILAGNSEEKNLLDSKGEYFFSIWELGDNYLQIKNNGKIGLINHNGKVIVRPIYGWISGFSEGRAWVNIGGTPDENGIIQGDKWGLDR
jgi:hypothetical protein